MKFKKLNAAFYCATKSKTQSRIPVFLVETFRRMWKVWITTDVFSAALCLPLPISLSPTSPLCSCITICLVLRCYAGHFLALFICPVS